MDTGSGESSDSEIRSVKTVLVIEDEELNLKLVASPEATIWFQDDF